MTRPLSVSLDRRQASWGAALANPVGYTEDIQPMFNQVCAACHGPVVQTMGLGVTDYESLLKGGQNGPVVTPGDPNAPKLWDMINTGRMPLIGELAPEQKRLIYT
ncbi:MAG: c-type cytochrome domain-containing protein [Caldilineaceae bacterium]